LGLSDAAGKSCFNIFYAVIYISSVALSEHLNVAVRQVSDKAGQLVAVCNPVGGEAKADALDLANECYVFCDHSSLCVPLEK